VSSDLDLDPLLKRLHLANARRAWRDLVQRAEKEQWSYDALLLTLFSEEVAHRRGTRLTRAVSAAAFPFLRTIDEFDFTYQSTLRLTTIGSLLTPDFVTEGHSVILEGKPGRGKTHLAIALAYRAMQNGFDALFTTAAELIDELSAASKDGRLRDALARYIKPHVLVVDEVGYLPYGDDAASVLYHVVNDRHIRRRAMVFTTNKHPKRWGDVLHDDDLAEAIVDRVLERGRLLRLDGPSLRTKHLPDDELQLNQDIHGDRRVSGKDTAEFPERTRVLDLRQFQCVRDACRRLVVICRLCDHGQMYCPVTCREVGRRASRRRSKAAYWRSKKGKRATAARMTLLRASRKIVTDAGREEVGLSEKVSVAAAAFTTEVTPPAAEETTDERHLDGHLAGAERDACDRDGGPERDDLEGAAPAETGPPAGDGDAARSGGAVAGGEGPRCAQCGRLGWGVRLGFLSRRIPGLRGAALHPGLGPRVPSGPPPPRPRRRR
jgi:DNA replication protein DnaC